MTADLHRDRPGYSCENRWLVLGAILAVGIAILWWTAARQSSASMLPPLPVRGDGPVSIAATGDTLLLRPLTTEERRAASTLVLMLGSADVALTNLETSLVSRERAPRTMAASRWPSATADAADMLRRLGINVASLANNHTADFGAGGIDDTRRILDSHGLHHAGAGEDLQTARAPVIVGTAPRRVAIVAVAASASVESRAGPSWAGINPLGYNVEVTVDPATFDTLKKSAVAKNSDADTLLLSGRTIKRGLRTAVDVVVDPTDERQILERIARARTEADVVIVSLHAHEPRNDSDEPAAFVRRFARAAIESGAALVVGHGPHRLRGVEAYGRGAILYSVGNFIFEPQELDATGLDLYDSGVDLYGTAMGANDFGARRQTPTFNEAEWWEAVIARATFEHGGLASLQLVPVDLGVDLQLAQRGFPRLAAADRANRIVSRLSRLSSSFDTRVVTVDGVATVAIERTALESR